MNNENTYLKWDEFFIAIANICSLRSKDPNTKVGACIADENNRIISTGYNGLPIGLDDNNYPWDKRKGNLLDVKYPYVIHAEMNAILFAKINLKNAKLYATLFPCSICARLIIQSEIKAVYYVLDKYINSDDNLAAKRMFNDSKTKLIQVPNILINIKKTDN